jgi:hypothetical protein
MDRALELANAHDQLANMRSAMAAIAARMAVFEDSQARQQPGVSAESVFYDRQVAARGSELQAYRHYLDRIISAVNHNRAVLLTQHPDLASDLAWMDSVSSYLASLDRLLALHSGALSIAQSKGWAIYTQYVANLRPYAANPPDNWRSFDFSILDAKQLKLASEMARQSPQNQTRRFGGKRKQPPGSSSKAPRDDSRDK